MESFKDTALHHYTFTVGHRLGSAAGRQDTGRDSMSERPTSPNIHRDGRCDRPFALLNILSLLDLPSVSFEIQAQWTFHLKEAYRLGGRSVSFRPSAPMGLQAHYISFLVRLPCLTLTMIRDILTP